MTPAQAISEIEALKICSLNSDNRVVRERLQSFFAEVLSEYDRDRSFGPALEKGYMLLREVENCSSLPERADCRYDVAEAVRELMLCAGAVASARKTALFGELCFENAYISVDMRNFARAFFSLTANAFKYSCGEDVFVRLTRFDGFVALSVNNSGSFPAQIFRNAVEGRGSLGFVNRLMKSAGGSLIMSDGGGTVSLALKIPEADSSLPCALPFTADELIGNRLSGLYVSFCAH